MINNDEWAFFIDDNGNMKCAGVCVDCTNDCKQSFRSGVVECAKYIPTPRAKYRTIPVHPNYRELSAEQPREINKLVKQCASFIPKATLVMENNDGTWHEYEAKNQCLPLDCRCVMVDKVYNERFCKWFENAVLPLNPALQAVLKDKNTNIKNCGICGKTFPAARRKTYCSEKCRYEAKKRADAKRAKKYRSNKG